ncbi:MAG TPA: hypothetical protein VGE66_13085 [Chitinophagaceae bacterium]
MKTLQLSAIALCLFGAFSSCTKDTLSSQDSLSSATRGGGQNETPGQGGTPPGQGDNPSSDNQGGGNGRVDPSLTVIYDPAVGIKGEPVTVTGTFDETTGVAVPDCGKLQLQMLVGTEYVGVGAPVNVTTSNHEVTYTFTPTVVGDEAYSFKVHYVAAGCDGFNENMSGEFPLKVVEPCLPLALKGELTKHTPLGNNKYEFEVTYTVTSCPAMGAAKLQGGLTAVTGFTDAGMWTNDTEAEGEERKHTQNDNHIIMWNFQIGEQYERIFKVTFTKELKGTAPYELTGQWSVSAKDPITGIEIKPTAAPITFTP